MSRCEACGKTKLHLHTDDELEAEASKNRHPSRGDGLMVGDQSHPGILVPEGGQPGRSNRKDSND